MRISRAVATAAALFVTALAATGCVTVNGSSTPVEALDKRAAETVLHDYEARNNQAYADRDLGLNARAESGSLGALDQAGLRILTFTDPRGDRGKAPITYERPEYLIPRIVGWPKWFAVQGTPNYAQAKPRLLVFLKGGPDAEWRAAWGPTLQGPLPELKRDADGYLEQVPVTAPGLAATPTDVGGALVEYLRDGRTRAELFAPDSYTGQLRKQREDPIGEGFVRQTFDSVAGRFPPLAVRTQDGGALALFALQHSTKLTVQAPRRLGDVEASTLTFLPNKPTTALTEHRISEYVAVLPKAGEKVRLIGWNYGLVGADGE